MSDETSGSNDNKDYTVLIDEFNYSDAMEKALQFASESGIDDIQQSNYDKLKFNMDPTPRTPEITKAYLMKKFNTELRLQEDATNTIKGAEIEVDKLGRTMGKQDHFAAAYGNLNVFTFHKDEKVTVEPVFYRPETRMELEKNLLMFYTRFKRDASEVLTSQEQATPNKREVLRQMRDLVPELRDVLANGVNLNCFGEILHAGWQLKRSITSEISNSEIDEYYQRARRAGALGGKLLGAGGGGFLLFYVEPQNQLRVIDSLKDLYHMRFGLDAGGSRITYYDQTEL